MLENADGLRSSYLVDESVEVDTFPLNQMQLMRIETNIKLNVVNWQDEALISGDELSKPEVHFVQCEWNVDNYPANDKLGHYKKLAENAFGVYSDQQMGFIFTDFDNILKGNPIV